MVNHNYKLLLSKQRYDDDVSYIFAVVLRAIKHNYKAIKHVLKLSQLSSILIGPTKLSSTISSQNCQYQYATEHKKFMLE